LRVVFLGTPEFAVPALDALAREHEVALVVAQPDKPAGRGMHMHAPAVAVRAKALGLPLAQPAKIREAAALDAIRAARPDVGIVVAYGKILPNALLEIPRHGFINIHASLLPRYRGAAPIQRAIEHGEAETGVTIMRVDEELDHGARLAVAKTAIDPDEHTPSLAARLSALGAEALLPVLEALANGTAVDTPQEHAVATYASKIEKQEGHIDWSASARSIYDKYRAFDPWPGVFTDTLKLNEIAPATGSGQPGTILTVDESGVTVAAGEDAIRLITVQRPGKSRISAFELARTVGWRAGMPL